MGTGVRTLKEKIAKISAAESPTIPKMELAARRNSARRPRVTRRFRFTSLASLIVRFGEFKLLADSSGTIIGLWISGNARRQRAWRSLLGCKLREILHPDLLAEIEDIARRTAVTARRQEVKCPLKVRGRQLSFSVCAQPITSAEAPGPALCLEARDVTHRVSAMKSLQEREALLTHAEQLANFGSWEMDLRSRDVKLSPQLMRILELSPDQKITADTVLDRIHSSDRMRVRQLVKKSVADGRPLRYVARYRAADGSVRVHLAHTLPLFDENGKVVRALGVIQDITEQSESHDELRRLSQQLMNEQDRQRRHLAQELHESAGQSLAALKMTLGRLRDELPDGALMAASLLESAVELADGAVREVRTVSYLLHPPMLDDAGLGPALRWYVKGFTERSGVNASIDIPEPFPRYSQEIETTVFRVVQEALTNVHRYSGSASTQVRVDFSDSQLRVEIIDRGCGIPPGIEPALRRMKLGVGIPGMRERVEQLDGTFEIDSVPGVGTTVRALLPARPRNAPQSRRPTHSSGNRC